MKHSTHPSIPGTHESDKDIALFVQEVKHKLKISGGKVPTPKSIFGFTMLASL